MLTTAGSTRLTSGAKLAGATCGPADNAAGGWVQEAVSSARASANPLGRSQEVRGTGIASSSLSVAASGLATEMAWTRERNKNAGQLFFGGADRGSSGQGWRG